MKITILTGHYFNRFAAELARRLRDLNIELSVVICIDCRSLLKGVFDKIRKKQLRKCIKKDLSPPLGASSRKYGFDIFFSNHINSKRTEAILKNIKPDIAIQAGVGIVRKKILDIPEIGILNAHMGLLPKYRGMNVLEWSLFYGDPLGVTVHFLDEGIDTGDVLLKREITIGKGDTIESLREKANKLSIDLLIEAVKGIKSGSIKPIKQKKEDGKQYFVMHPGIKEITGYRLQAACHRPEAYGLQSAPYNIMHILYSFSLGGLEAVLASLINRMDPERFTHSICVFCGELAALKKIERKDVKVFIVERNFRNDPTVVFRLARLLRKERPDVVSTYNWAGVEGIIAAKLSGVKKIIHSEHGFDIGEIFKQKKRRILARRLILGFCDKVIVPAKTLQNWLRSVVKIEKGKVLYIPNGCDTEKFKPGKDLQKRKQLGIGETDIVVGNVGALKKLKGQDILIKAFASLCKPQAPSPKPPAPSPQHPASSIHQIKLLLVGDGPQRRELELLAEELGIKEKVIFTGEVAETLRFYNTMDIFVLPSLSESSSIALLEAMATGLPVVAADVGDVRHIVGGGRGGVLVSPGDSHGLAEGIKFFIEDKKSAEEKSGFALKRARDLFSLDNMVKSYEEVFSL